ncbi:MAG TPA: 2-phosphosulfolactate phosphatase [Rhodocyclaceae bacterium]|jgi:2-phosphosulfolactate phosphatase|nr:2-phosphosulfolactate phosphatase [Rhodocyclaceae bacterium]
MRFSRLFLNRLQNQPPVADTVVVIDVLRSFTTAAVALARGATAVYPVEAVASVSVLRERLPGAVTVGAIRGGEPVPGFDFGNSPSALLKADLAGRPVILSTAAGVRGLQHFRHVQRLYAASLVCAKATAAAIRAAGAEEVCFIITGEWVDRDGDEDVACADYLEALLKGEPADPEAFARRVRQSDFGRRFQSGEWPNLPLADLELAARVDCFDFAMAVKTEGDHLVLRSPQAA